MLVYYSGNAIEILWESDGKTIGAVWEYPGNALAILWDNHGDTVGILWKLLEY